MKRNWLLVLVLCLSFALTACTGSAPEKTAETYTIEIGAQDARIFVGDTISCTATVRGSDGADLTDPDIITWSSSDPAIAAIDASGEVTGVAEGTATITAAYTKAPEVSATVEVVVGVHVSSLTLEESSLDLLTGSDKADAQLHAQVEPANAVYQDVIFSSSDESIATVDASGIVHAVAPGTAVISAASADEVYTQTDVCEVTVTQGVSSIELSEKQVNAYLGDDVSLSATVLPEDAADPSVEWTSSDESVLTVGENGKLTLVGPGKAEIVCKALDGSEVSASCPVEVVVGVKSVQLSAKIANLLLGSSENLKSITLTCTAEPENATFQDFTWSSSDENVAKVDENGVVSAVGAGEATITAVSNDPRTEGAVNAVCKISVGDAVLEIQIAGKGRVVKGKSAQMTATVLPETALSSKVTWSSSDKNVLTIDKEGKVKTVGVGTATITATSADGSGVIATKTITVYQPVTKLKMSKKSATIFAGQTVSLSAKASPSDASDKSVTWSSSKTSVATVDSNGVVRGIKKGSATITAKANDGSGIKCSITVNVEPANPVTVKSAGFGIYNANLFALTVKNSCAKKTVVNFDFDIDLYSYTGAKLYTSGSYNLGSNVKIGPGASKQIKRTMSGISATYQLKLTITGVKFSDGSKYYIPASEQVTWTFTR